MQLPSGHHWTGRWRLLLVGAAALLLAPLAQAQGGDPAARVGRISAAQGELSLAPAGANQWGRGELNRPVVAGDRLMTGGDSRAAVQLGGAELRLDDRVQLDVLSLDGQRAQTQLTQGALNLRVDRLDSGDSYEVDTPVVAFVASEPGEYRIEVTPDRSATTVVVYSGSATVYGRDGVSRRLDNRQAYTFDDPDLQQWNGSPLPAYDAFDRWCFARDERGDERSSRYVAPGVVGAEELDDYGRWRPVEDYGQVWFPSVVATDWAPYRYGHWVWISPWGWTWVDDAPWGYAPSHYGRWVYVDQRWGWVPGPATIQPVWAPALVAFVGGNGWSVAVSSGPPVGWFPLGPREVYCPPYPVSRTYFNNVNIANTTIVNNTYIENVYSNYQRHAPVSVPYMNRAVPGAMTVVSQDTFTHARPVPTSLLRPPPQQLAAAPLTLSPGVRPTTLSRFGGDGVNHSLPAPRSLFQRPQPGAALQAPPAAATMQPVPGARMPTMLAREPAQMAAPMSPQPRPQGGSESPAMRAPWTLRTSPAPQPAQDTGERNDGAVRGPRWGGPTVQAPDGDTRMPGRQWQTRPDGARVPGDDMSRTPPVVRSPDIQRPPMQTLPQPRADTPRDDTPRDDTPRDDGPRYDMPRRDMPRYEAPRDEGPRYEAPRPMPMPQPREEFHTRPSPMPQPAPQPMPRPQFNPQPMPQAAPARPAPMPQPRTEAPHGPMPRPAPRDEGQPRHPD